MFWRERTKAVGVFVFFHRHFPSNGRFRRISGTEGEHAHFTVVVVEFSIRRSCASCSMG